jgi:hypothetical protein
MSDPNQLLMGTGIPSVKFERKGQIVKGKIHSVELQQQRDFKTRELLTWDDGKPMMQIVVTLQTDERNPENPNDDGMRRLFVRRQMQQAVRTAVVQAGATGLEPGGTLAVQWFDEEPPETVGMSPKKLYQAQYVPPAQAQASDLLGASQPAEPAAVQPHPTTDPASLI